MPTPQALIVLGGYTFVTNPTTYNYDTPTSSSYDPTFSGGYITNFGQFVTDYTINMSWDSGVLNYAQYQELETLKTTCASTGSLSFVGPDGLACTVFFETLTKSSLLPAGLYAYQGVKAVLRVISIP